MTDNTWNWIPTSKPPDNTRLVIVWMEGYGLRLAYFHIGAWHWMDGEIAKTKVTHWCEPLPPPPKPDPFEEWWVKATGIPLSARSQFMAVARDGWKAALEWSANERKHIDNECPANPKATHKESQK